MNAAASNILVVLLMATLFMFTATSAEAQGLGLFRVEGQAQQHCPNDTVVWLDLKKRIYYLQSQRQYGRGRTAVFACRNEARRSGNRRSLLGWR
jgi:nitrous oxide reductase accessory protein NosL